MERVVDFPRGVSFFRILAIALFYIFPLDFSKMEFPLIPATVVTVAYNKNERKAQD
jgi:hypothetical protein